MLKFGLLKEIKILQEMKVIRDSGLFSPSFYLDKYIDVSSAGLDPLRHYCEHGWKEGRVPSVEFDQDAFIKDNPEVLDKKINPLLYFIKINKDSVVKLSKKNLKLFFDKYLRKVQELILKKHSYTYHEPMLTDEVHEEILEFKYKPLMSVIIPVFNVDPKWLEKAIKSVEGQWYQNWEISIADDSSTNIETIKYLKNLDNRKISVKFLKENQNISVTSNEALKQAKGDYIVLMDHDDELTPDALYEVVKAINLGGAEFIYSDEDKIEMNGEYTSPNFKPDFSPDTFLSTNYLSHLGVIKKTLADKVGGFSIGLEGSQDYDLYLKVLEHTTKVTHVPKVLYHWRKIPGSTASSFGEKSYANEAGRYALQRAMKRRGIKANVVYGHSPGLYRIKYDLESKPLVSIVIPFKDMPDVLSTCVESILTKSTYENYEIIGISNNSSDEKTHSEMERLENLDSRIKFHEYNVPFNYSKINNYAVSNFSNGEHVLFLNNDIEIISPEWIEELLMYSQQQRIGIVGCKLYYPNDTIQHAGLVIAPFTPHALISNFNSFPRGSSGYASRLVIVNNYSAVTAACMMMKRKIFDDVGGFDEEDLKIAYNDVDLCLKVVEKGLLNVYTPYCEAYHHESKSRGLENTTEKLIRCGIEQNNLKKKHPDLFLADDKYYNKNLDCNKNNFSVSPLVTDARDHYIGKEFVQKISQNLMIAEKKFDYLCVFSHFDLDNKIHEYVVHYLKFLSKFSDLIFVTTCSDIDPLELNKIKPYCTQIIVKENIGYDFGAWKTGLELLNNPLESYENLVLCNDSVYGPLYDFENTIKVAMKRVDVFGMTESYENEHHLQSYFIVYNKKAFSSSLFLDFWKNLKIYDNKKQLVIENEVKYHNLLLKSELKVDVLCSANDVGNLNPLHYKWDKLILNEKFPYIKVELLRDNPRKVDIDQWESIVSRVGYSIQMIKNHLNKN